MSKAVKLIMNRSYPLFTKIFPCKQDGHLCLTDLENNQGERSELDKPLNDVLCNNGYETENMHKRQ
jgi:hypothetical protein